MLWVIALLHVRPFIAWVRPRCWGAGDSVAGMGLNHGGWQFAGVFGQSSRGPDHFPAVAVDYSVQRHNDNTWRG